jgi:metal-responsive CopG/Arc/MetJ family transcriptional regulator
MPQEILMAEDKKKQVNVDFSNFPELYDDLEKLVEEIGNTDRSKLVRQFVQDGIEEYRHLGNIKKRVVSPKIRQVSRS